MMYAAISPPACTAIVNTVTYECEWLLNGNTNVQGEFVLLRMSVRYEDGIPTYFYVQYNTEIGSLLVILWLTLCSNIVLSLRPVVWGGSVVNKISVIISNRCWPFVQARVPFSSCEGRPRQTTLRYCIHRSDSTSVTIGIQSIYREFQVGCPGVIAHAQNIPSTLTLHLTPQASYRGSARDVMWCHQKG